MSKALVVVGNKQLGRQGGADLTEFEDDVRALLTELAPRNGGLNLPTEFAEAVEEIAKGLTAFLPWLALPLALIPGMKKMLARHRFSIIMERQQKETLMSDLAERLRKLGFNETQIESMLRPPVYIGQTADPAADDYVSEETLESMGMVRICSGSFDV